MCCAVNSDFYLEYLNSYEELKLILATKKICQPVIIEASDPCFEASDKELLKRLGIEIIDCTEKDQEDGKIVHNFSEFDRWAVIVIANHLDNDEKQGAFKNLMGLFDCEAKIIFIKNKVIKQGGKLSDKQAEEFDEFKNFDLRALVGAGDVNTDAATQVFSAFLKTSV